MGTGNSDHLKIFICDYALDQLVALSGLNIVCLADLQFRRILLLHSDSRLIYVPINRCGLLHRGYLLVALADVDIVDTLIF